MDREQAEVVRVLAKQHRSSSAEVLWLARVCSANEQLMSLEQLTKEEAADLIYNLQAFGRWKQDFPLGDACELNLS